MEQFAAWHEETGTVIRPVQAVSEDIFIRTVRPRCIVNCLIAPPRNILTYLLTYLLRTVIWLGDMDSPEGWWTAIRSVPHDLLGIRWFHFVTNASVTSQTGEEGLAIRICRRRLSIFGHVRRLPEATPAHSALRLAVDTRAGGKPDIKPEWKRQRGRPCRLWVQQTEENTGLNANDA